ncbi:unnamed protein product, partial [Schistocephalus solidus]|uniref:Ig-like domain-containing protein n=1 Tax=Schistocephalus solidus TaxID=70667 RepID=A0A183TF36_SCHSO
TLVFSHLTVRDTAVFQCNISNRNGFAFANAYLNVWDSPPAIIDGPPEQTVCVEKQALRLYCRTVGAPKAVVLWSRDDNLQLGSNQNTSDRKFSRFIIEADGTLFISATVVNIFCLGPPEPPSAIKLDCKYDAATQSALLIWEPGSDNNAPITDISLEYIYGSYRPLYIKHRETPGVSASKVIEDLQSALLSDDWQLMKHILVNFEPTFSTVSAGQALVNLTAHMMIMTLYADVAYQFRLRLINAAGSSGPSSVVPGFDNEMGSTCIFPPQPPLTQPEDVLIYGNKPNNLVVSWEIIPPLRHSGPGLQYHVTLRCLDCDYELPTYAKTDNVSLNWKETKVIFSADTTSQQAAVHKFYPIEIFKKYEVQITTSNLVGFSKSPPATLTGWSAEAKPMITPTNLRIANIEAASVDVLWDWPSTDDIAKKINGFFVGFRISWCPGDKPLIICERYKVIQVPYL